MQKRKAHVDKSTRACGCVRAHTEAHTEGGERDTQMQCFYGAGGDHRPGLFCVVLLHFCLVSHQTAILNLVVTVCLKE